MMNKKILVVLLFTAYPVLSLYSANLHQTLFADIFFPLFILISLSLVLLLILNRFLRNLQFSALLIANFNLFFFSFRHFRNIFKNLNFLDGFLRDLLSVLILITLFVYLVHFLNKNRKNLKLIFRYYTVLSVTLISLPLFNITTHFYNNLKIKKQNISILSPEIPKYSEARNKPDVYYFILDRYA